MKIMTQLKTLPGSTGEFKTIRKEKWLYVDKTELLYSLIEKGSKKYFLSRPRRFGKSLTVSTLEALFQGHKVLFEGLWIYDKWDWTPFSVVRLDFSKISTCESKKELEDKLGTIILKIAKSFGLNSLELENKKWDNNLDTFITELKAKGPVAILIDEYDAPFHKALKGGEELLEITKQIIGEFYEILKSLDLQYDFLFVTGITKIAKTSLFSGMNILHDISLDAHYATLCGITQTELESSFSGHIDHLASLTNTSRNETLLSLQKMYNGYRFSHQNSIRVYNPFSLHHAFQSHEMRGFWFESGTPTLLLTLIKQNNYDLSFLGSPTLSLQEVTTSHEFLSMSLPNLLLQTGYMTIKEVLPSNTEFAADTGLVLDFPNLEVRQAFLNVLLKSIRGKEVTYLEKGIGKELIDYLKAGEWDKFAKSWNELLAYIPYQLHISQEKYYHSLVVLFFLIFGLKAHVELATSIGQMDLAIELADRVYIIEFKLNSTASNALKQIHQKRYYEVFLKKGKPIYLVGMTFGSKSKAIEEIWLEELETSVVTHVFKREEDTNSHKKE